MIIRIPKTFRLLDAPATVSISADDAAQLLGDLPGTVADHEEEWQFQFESPRAATDFASQLTSSIPYLAADMGLEEELLFSQWNQESVEAALARPVQSRSGTAVAALAVAISGTGIAVVALILGILGVAL